MTQQKLTDREINGVREILRMVGETEEFIAEEVKRLKDLHGYEGRGE